MPTTVFDDSFDVDSSASWYLSGTDVAIGGGSMTFTGTDSTLCQRPTNPADRFDSTAWADMEAGAMVTYEVADLDDLTSSFQLAFPSNDALEWYVDSGNLECWAYDGPSSTQIGSVPVLAFPFWLRLAVLPDRSLAKWQVSPDQVVWATTATYAGEALSYADPATPDEPRCQASLSIHVGELNRVLLTTYASDDPDPTVDGEEEPPIVDPSYPPSSSDPGGYGSDAPDGAPALASGVGSPGGGGGVPGPAPPPIEVTGGAHTGDPRVVTPQPYGQFIVAVTPVLRQAEDITFDDYLLPTQFSDVTVTHPHNDGRTASVKLSMYDPIVSDLRPYEHALRIWYARPNQEDTECIFWGQTNVLEDYEAGTVQLDAQDASIRYQHHYLRLGDEALNDPKNNKAGHIYADDRGIQMLVDASFPFSAEAPSPTTPLPGAILIPNSLDDERKIGVERGQELWEILMSMVTAIGGPDIDLWPNQSITGVYEETKAYVFMMTFEHLGTHRENEVFFEYGYERDNVQNVTVAPDHPTTRAVVVDEGQHWRVSQFAPFRNKAMGQWEEWVTWDHKVKGGDTDVLEKTAESRLRAHAGPPKQIEFTLRPDIGQRYFYGHPDADVVTPGDFYIADWVKVKAIRGYRHFSGTYQIVAVELTQSGPRAPIVTKLTVIPNQNAVTLGTPGIEET